METRGTKFVWNLIPGDGSHCAKVFRDLAQYRECKFSQEKRGNRSLLGIVCL